MKKHIIIVHGRSTKPQKKEKLRLTRQALHHGLTRVSDTAARKVKEGRVAVDLAYYGDINNAILWAHKGWARAHFSEAFLKTKVRYEADGRYDQAMQDLLARPTTEQTKAKYRELRQSVKDKGWYDEAADILSPIARVFGVNDEIINRFLPDLGAYFKHRVVGSLIRARLQEVLVPALKNDADICLIAHSMGSIVAYDVLWKLSRMSEYRAVRSKKVNTLLTLGSPLGEPAVNKQLYDAGEPQDGRFPTNIVNWENFTAEDDFVARDEDIADDFKEMKKRRYLSRLKDRSVHTFYVGDSGLNPHKLYGYLDNREVARAIATWMNRN